MNKQATRYCKEIEKKLWCSMHTRKKLLNQFYALLSSFLEDYPNAEYHDLVEAFGEPEMMARILMEKVSEREQTCFQNRKKLTRILGAVLVALFVAFSLYVFFDKEYSVITFSDSITAEPSTNITQEGE